MAEQSIGMTSGFGDGVTGGYVTGRMTQMELKTLGNGQLIYTNTGSTQPFALSGTGSSTLTIGDGASMVAGWFYENTGAVNISVTGLPAATYNIVIAVNNSGGTQAVIRAVGGAATIAAYTVRLALVSSIPSPGIQVGTVETNGTSITAINYTYESYNVGTSLSRQVFAQMSGGTATLTAANTFYDITSFSAGTVINSPMDRILSINSTAGLITVNKTDMYMVSFSGQFTSGTTSWRQILIKINATRTGIARHAAPGSTTHEISVSSLQYLTAGDVVGWSVNSGLATQSFSNGSFTIARV